MGVKEIKQHWILSCDCCGKSVTQTGTHRPSKWVLIKVGADALDMHGSPAADASRDILLCDDCGPKVTSAINAKAAEIRAALGDTP